MISGENRSLLVLGAGGHSCVVGDVARLNGYESITFVGEREDDGPVPDGWTYLGRDTDLSGLREYCRYAICGIGDNRVRMSCQLELEQLSFEIATLIHPAAVVGPTAGIGPGSVVFAGAIVNFGAETGRATILNTGSSIDHHCRLGDGVHIAPGAVLGGNVSVGDLTWVGIGASVRNNIAIGSDVRIGAGAAVVRDVPQGETWVGVPARPL